ncbi:hypothetical protein [Streptomyces sp. NPDC005283]|uniref:hypothetical protein n=1 Tax=Streptomyces sp. NPDC005283 TaxID=3156871 RepID=UPI003451869D
MILPVVGRPSRLGADELAAGGMGGRLCVGGERRQRRQPTSYHVMAPGVSHPVVNRPYEWVSRLAEACFPKSRTSVWTAG